MICEIWSVAYSNDNDMEWRQDRTLDFPIVVVYKAAGASQKAAGRHASALVRKVLRIVSAPFCLAPESYSFTTMTIRPRS